LPSWGSAHWHCSENEQNRRRPVDKYPLNRKSCPSSLSIPDSKPLPINHARACCVSSYGPFKPSGATSVRTTNSRSTATSLTPAGPSQAWTSSSFTTHYPAFSARKRNIDLRQTQLPQISLDNTPLIRYISLLSGYSLSLFEQSIWSSA